MKKDIQILFNKVKKLEATNLPLSDEEIRNLIETGKSSVLQDKSNNIFSKKWRKKMIAIGSILAGASISLMLLFSQHGSTGANSDRIKSAVNPGSTQTLASISANNFNDTALPDSSVDSKKSVETDKDKEFILKSFDEVPPDYIMKKSPDFKWNEIEYDQLSTEFIGKQVFSIINKEKELKGAKHYSTKIEFEDLIRVYNEISGDMSEFEYFGIKDIGQLSDKEFYAKLENTLAEIIQKKKISDEVYRKFELYAMISHKLANNFSGVNFLSLNTEELEKIGIKMNDSSYYYQSETIFEKIPEWLDKEMMKHSFPEERNKPVLIKYNKYVFWWCRNDVSNNKIQFVDGFNEPDFSTISEKNDTTRVFACMAQYMKDYSGWKFEDYNPLSPVFSGIDFNTGLSISPLLYYGTGGLKNYYDLHKQFREINASWRKDGVDKQTKDSLQKLELRIFKDTRRLLQNLQANTLLPVKLLVPDTTNPKYKGFPAQTVYFLFVPNDAFLNALPNRYSVSLRKEIDAIKKIESGELPYYEACKGLSFQETFFDVCKIESENIKDVKTYPNPAKGMTKLDFTLLQDRFVNISMYDLNGKFIREIKNWQKFSSKRITVDIDLKDIRQGMYLITVSTDKGEKVVQRLVVE